MLIAPLKWHGGKHYLAKRIVDMMPRHLHYVEPYFGGGAVLLERDPNDHRLWLTNEAGLSGVSEIVNDINGDLMNFWRVLQHVDQFHEFVRVCQATPLARAEWQRAGDVLASGNPRASGQDDATATSADPVGRAWAFFVHCRQSRAGTFKDFTSLTRSRTRRGINGNASEWLSAVDGLAAIHARLRPVVIENMDALDLIRREDEPGTLFYLDPPYLHQTRVSRGAYANEMTNRQHECLLEALSRIRGKFILSGYRSTIYDDIGGIAGWTRHDFNLANHAAGGKRKRRMTECLWCNFQPAGPAEGV